MLGDSWIQNGPTNSNVSVLSEDIQIEMGCSPLTATVQIAAIDIKYPFEKFEIKQSEIVGVTLSIGLATPHFENVVSNEFNVAPFDKRYQSSQSKFILFQVYLSSDKTISEEDIEMKVTVKGSKWSEHKWYTCVYVMKHSINICFTGMTCFSKITSAMLI